MDAPIDKYFSIGLVHVVKCRRVSGLLIVLKPRFQPNDPQSRRFCRARKRPKSDLRSGFMSRTGTTNELVDTVGDALSGDAQLCHGPVGGAAVGAFLGRGMVEQPLGQAGRQHEIAVGDGDEAVAWRMIPNFRAARLSDAPIEMLDGFEMAERAGL